jgi:hypothetical protein
MSFFFLSNLLSLSKLQEIAELVSAPLWRKSLRRARPHGGEAARRGARVRVVRLH